MFSVSVCSQSFASVRNIKQILMDSMFTFAGVSAFWIQEQKSSSFSLHEFQISAVGNVRATIVSLDFVFVWFMFSNGIRK